MSFYTCKDIGDENIERAIELHIEHLSYRSFITNFGKLFLLTLYKDWLEQKNAILIFSEEENKITGFVLGIVNKNLLFSPIISAPFKYLKFILPAVIKKPVIILKLFETLFYKRKSKISCNSELLVIVTAGNARSKSIGSKLVIELGKEFIKYNIWEYVVTVHAEMERSNNFYIKNNFKYNQSFNLYGTMWNMYLKNNS